MLLIDDKEKMMQDDYNPRLHRTLVQLLIDSNYREVAALLVDGSMFISQSEWNSEVVLDVPPSSYSYIETDNSICQVIEEAVRTVCFGRVTDRDGDNIAKHNIAVIIRVKLLDVEDDWQAVIKELIAQEKETNHGVITEKVFARNKKQVYTYNEMKFASQSEIRIAQELERKQVLFFPLPLAVRRDTGDFYKDHREADFVICQEGVWGILEVAFHPDRYEQDSEKDLWFKKSGILCIQNFTAEACYNNPSSVVNKFLELLAKHKR